MKDKEQKNTWMELCGQAAVEQDPQRLMELVKEIDRLLAEKEARLKANRAKNEVPGTGANAE